MLTPKSPDQTWLHSYLYPSLIDAPGYELDAPQNIAIKLDQNESPWDWPDHLKDKILAKTKSMHWNRYPIPMADDVTALLAKYLDVNPKAILTAPGSNHLIALLLDTFGHRLSGKIRVLRPSFPLFEMHCRYSGLAYEPWLLKDDLEFDVSALDNLPKNSLVIFASPNNPTGTFLPYADLKKLLVDNPQSLFIADEAYYEFSDEPYTQLLQDHANLILIRTLSKTMGGAGIRMGYILAAPEIIYQVNKLRLPYLLNHFTTAAASLVFADSEMKAFVQQNITHAKRERNRLYESLGAIGHIKDFQVKRSRANFLILRWPTQEKALAAYQSLIQKGILVRNVSKGPGLSGCLRITLGTETENNALIAAIGG